MFYGIDYTYIIFVLPALIIAMWASSNVNSTFNKYKKVSNSRGWTAHEVARKILDINGLYHVKIERVAGHLSDHFDPRTNIVRLSDSTYDSTSVAALGVAAHEVGHAIQHATAYMPIKVRNAIVPVVQISSYAAFPLAILGIIFANDLMIVTGIVLFTAVVLFQIITLPVEFNASRRAIKTLGDEAILEYEELSGAKKVLTAAALTYVASAAVAIANLLRLLVLAGGRNRD
ncbi:MAG: zinc metallopeptidase [Clostridia bacterium]|nr:zinc metallopeptidase [Clostridia bacterium]